MPALHQRFTRTGRHAMDPLQKEALRKNRVKLTSDLLVDEILPYLVDCGLFTDHMLDCVASHRTRLQKVQQLLSDLPRRGPEAFPLFVECLVHSGQKHLADAIQDTVTQLQQNAPQTNYGYGRPHTAPTYRNYRNMPPQSATFQPPQNAPFQPPQNAPFQPPQNFPFQPHPNNAFQPGQQNAPNIISHSGGLVAQPEDESNTFPAGGGSGQGVKQEPGQSQSCQNSDEKMVVDDNEGSQNHFHAGSSYYSGSVNMAAAVPPGGIIPGQSAQFVDLKNLPQTRQRFTGHLQQNEVLPVNDPEDEFIYKMTSKPRGHALIINNRYFHGLQLTERLGTDVDRDNLQNVFKALNYNVTVFDNMKGREMENAIKGFSMRDSHKDVDSTIVVLLSHGAEGVIYGTDCVPVEVDKLIKSFDGAHCPALRGKPKLFVIQACRGKSLNSGFETTDGETAPSGDAGPAPATRTRQNVVGPSMLERLQAMTVRETENLRKKLPEGADMLVAYATVPGFVSWRNSERGSWFIQELCQVLYEYAHKEDLLSMMTVVNNRVATAYESACKNKQMPAPVTTLRKKWFFYPRM